MSNKSGSEWTSIVTRIVRVFLLVQMMIIVPQLRTLAGSSDDRNQAAIMRTTESEPLIENLIQLISLPSQIVSDLTASSQDLTDGWYELAGNELKKAESELQQLADAQLMGNSASDRFHQLQETQLVLRLSEGRLKRKEYESAKVGLQEGLAHIRKCFGLVDNSNHRQLKKLVEDIGRLFGRFGGIGINPATSFLVDLSTRLSAQAEK